jgi:hypothetical protein
MKAAALFGLPPVAVLYLPSSYVYLSETHNLSVFCMCLHRTFLQLDKVIVDLESPCVIEIAFQIV